MTKKTEVTREYHFLITGKIWFIHNEEMNTAEFNTVITNVNNNFPVSKIAFAQQALQARLADTIVEGEYNVLNVVILNISNLGQFTTEEFQDFPEPTQDSE